jgi:hypothetical protein
VDLVIVLAAAGGFALSALALGLGLLFSGVRLPGRGFALLAFELWGLLLAAAASFIGYFFWAHLRDYGLRRPYIDGLAWLVLFTTAAVAAVRLHLPRLTRCSRWRALCAGLIAALTVSAGVAAAAYFLVQAALPLQQG